MTMTATLQSRRNMRRCHPVWRCCGPNCPQKSPIRTPEISTSTRARWRRATASSGATTAPQRPLNSNDRRHLPHRPLEPRSADDAAVWSLQDDGDILAVGELLADAQRRALPIADGADRANHVGLLQRSAAVFAAPDCRLMVVIEADQQHLGDADRGRRPAVALGRVDRRSHLLAV